MVLFSYGDDSVVTYLLLAVKLLTFDDSDETSPNCATGKGRLIHQQQDVDGIPILGAGSRQETEIVGKHHSGRKNLLQSEDTLIRIKSELIPVAHRRLHYHLKNAILLIYRLQLCWIHKTLHAVSSSLC